MRTILLALILVTYALEALAQWTPVGTSSIADSYADRSTIRRSGNLVKMWDMTDYKRQQTIGRIKYLSTKTFQEYDCKQVRVRPLRGIFYSGQMGRGEVLYQIDLKEPWMDVAPETLAMAVGRVACDLGQR